MNRKRGTFVVLLVLAFLFFFIPPVSAATGCYVYPQGSEDLYCVPGTLDTEAQADCADHPDCRFSQSFIPGSSCQEIPECAPVTCSTDCQTHAQGICTELGGSAVPENRYDEMCTPGCCKITTLFCQFGLNKFQCEQRARQLGRLPGLPDTIFDNPIGMTLQQCNQQYCGVEVQPGTLSGAILNQERQGIPNARITLEGTGIETTAAADGTYSFPSLTPGTFFVQAQAEGYATASATISIAPGRSVQHDFTLTASGDLADVAGTVYQNDGTPLPRATVRWNGPSGGQVTTDDWGAYLITGLPSGTYSLTASKVGFQANSRSLLIENAGRISPFDFTLSGAIFQGVEGTAFVDGRATYGVRIYIDGVFKGYSQYPDGRYRIALDARQEREQHIISASYQDYQFDDAFIINPGQTVTKNLLLTRYLGECTPPNPPQEVEEFSVQHVPGKKQARLQWQKPCPEVIGYHIVKNDVPFRSASPAQLFMIDTDVAWGETYTYSIIAQYGAGSQSTPVSGTFTMGQSECEGKYHDDSGWETFCQTGDTATRKTVWTCDNQNARRPALQCGDRDGAGQDFYCAPVSERNADCKDAGICSQAAAPFGLYSSSQQCYGTNTPERGTANYCYYDHTLSIVDQCKSCASLPGQQIESCFEYKSKDACTINSCLTTTCEWIDAAANAEPVVNYDLLSLPGLVTSETGHGYCVEQDYAKDDQCALCGSSSPPSSLFENYYCTANVCAGLGRCFSNSAVSSCASCGGAPTRDANCYTYATESECTAGNAISRSTFGEISLSQDQCGWGRCVWQGEPNGFSSGACVKDGNADSSDDCAEFQSSGERASCAIDNSPPRTTLLQEGIPVISVAHPDITFHGDDNFHPQGSQRNKLGIVGYCLTTADPRAPDACSSFTEESYPGRASDETVTVNVINSPYLQRDINGETYHLKFYSEDKYHNREEVQDAFVFIDTVPPQFDINEQAETTTDHTSLTVYLEGLTEPASCTFALTQLLPTGNAQTQTVSRVEQDKRVLFENLPGILYNITVSCQDDQDNVAVKSKTYTFDLEKRIDVISPPLHGAVASTAVSFQATTVTGATCRLFTTETNTPVADFISDEQGKEHHTMPLPGFVERSYPAAYKIVCADLLTREQYEDYFDFTVDFTPPETQIVLREEQREERPTRVGWREYFIESTVVDFECIAEGFACDQTFYCLGTGCDLLSSPNYRQYTSMIVLNQSTHICYYSTDQARNQVYAPRCGDVAIEGYGITLERPLAHYYHDEQWGVSNTPSFEVVFFTKVPTMECRFDSVPGFDYESSPGFKVLPPDAHGRYTLPSFPSGTGMSPYADRGGVKQIYVQCLNFAGELGPEQKLTLEFDPTAPQITDAHADPTILIEGNRVSLLVATDDKTVCKYSDTRQTDYSLMNYAFPGAEADLAGAAIDTPRVLQEDHRSEYYIGGFIGLTKEFSLTTQCKNGAGDLSEVKTIRFLVDYTQPGGIAAVWPLGEYLDTSDITVRVETTKNALCRLSDNGTSLPMDGAGGRVHTLRRLTPVEKKYQYPITCRLGDHTAEAVAFLTVDRTPPTVTAVQDGEYTCGDDVHVLVSTTDENLSAYYYELYQGDVARAPAPVVPSFGNRSVRESSELPPSGTLVRNQTVGPIQPISISLEGLNGSRYVVRIQARDAAGHWGRFASSDGVTFASRNESVCALDTSPPNVEVLLNESCTATLAELQCTDAIGCSNFRYGQDPTSSCQTTQSYLGQKILFSSSGWLCYYLEDSMGNNHTGQRQISFIDTDGDGIANSCDQCTSTLAGRTVDGRGCAEGEVPAGERNVDSDNDGLPDFWEKVYDADDCALNYASPDSNTNGVSDREEDYDLDELSNYEEYTQQLNPCLADAPPPSLQQPPRTLPSALAGEKSSFLAWLLLVIGLILIAGGTGYLAYYYRRNPVADSGKTVSSSVPARGSVSSSSAPGSWTKWFQFQRVRKEKAQRRERKDVFGTFGKDSATIPHVDSILRTKAESLPTLHTVAQRYVEHKDEIKPGLRAEEKSIFSKLESIAEQSKEKKIQQVVTPQEAKDIFSRLRKISSQRKK